MQPFVLIITFICTPFVLIITCICTPILLSVIIGLQVHYRRVIRKKDDALYRRMSENSRLEKEMSSIRIEKNIMEKMLKSKINALVWASDTSKTKERNMK